MPNKIIWSNKPLDRRVRRGSSTGHRKTWTSHVSWAPRCWQRSQP